MYFKEAICLTMNRFLVISYLKQATNDIKFMCTLKDLKDKLSLFDENTADSTITTNFKEIAKILIESCAIKKGDFTYAFTDIEFYFYNKNHKDIITHPRKCEAMQWYVNDFGGIDLVFKSSIDTVTKIKSGKKVSKPELNDNSYFGGILIRGLKNLDTNENIEGPWACAELFRLHNACGDCDFPTLIIQKTGQSVPLPIARYHLVKKNNEQEIEKKVRFILSTYNNGNDENLINDMVKSFIKFKDKEYRYLLKNNI